MTNTRLHKLKQASKLKQLYKATSLFTIALVLGITSLTALITPNAEATSLPNVVADPGFNIGSGFSDPIFTLIYSITLQPDGKILVGGWFTEFNGTPANRLIRLNPDGSKDISFDIGSGFVGSVLHTTLQLDGKILVGGAFTSFNGTTQNRLIRLNSDGTKDTSFDIGSGFNNNVNSINLQTDGKILVGGQFTSFNGTTQNRLIRLNSDGTKDTSFDIGSGFNNNVNSINLQTDGKILVGGQFTSFNGTTQNRLIRLNSDGSKDRKSVV